MALQVCIIGPVRLLVLNLSSRTQVHLLSRRRSTNISCVSPQLSFSKVQFTAKSAADMTVTGQLPAQDSFFRKRPTPVTQTCSRILNGLHWICHTVIQLQHFIFKKSLGVRASLYLPPSWTGSRSAWAFCPDFVEQSEN